MCAVSTFAEALMYLCAGYRHVDLRSETSARLELSSLFLHIKFEDVVIEKHRDFMEALMRPSGNRKDTDE
jgi:hypothetical protein